MQVTSPRAREPMPLLVELLTPVLLVLTTTERRSSSATCGRLPFERGLYGMSCAVLTPAFAIRGLAVGFGWGESVPAVYTASRYSYTGFESAGNRCTRQEQESGTVLVQMWWPWF
jgi:hypothetical protein